MTIRLRGHHDRCRRLRWTALALAALFAAAFARAAEPPRERWALIVGGAGAVTPAPHTPAQRRLALLLQSEFGYRPDRVIELYDERATLKEVRAALERLSEMNAGDTLFAYVLLPRLETKIGAALLPADGRRDQPWTLLTRADLEQAIARLKVRAAFAVFPACGLTPSEAEAPFRQSKVRSRLAALSTLTFCPPGDGIDAHAAFAVALVSGLEQADTRKGPIPAARLGETLRQSVRGLDVTYQRDAGYSDVEFEFVPERGRLDPYIHAVERRDSRPPSGAASSGTAGASPGGAARTPITVEQQTRAVADLVSAVRSETTAGDPEARSRAGRTTLSMAMDPANAIEVRVRAIRAIGELEYRQGIPALSELIARNRMPTATDEALRRAAVDTLAVLKGEETLGPLQRALLDPAPQVRAAAARALGSDPRLLPPQAFVPLLSDSSVDVRVAALQALSLKRQFNPSVRDAVRARLRDQSPEVRREAVTLLARTGDTASSAEVLRMLASPAEDVSVRQTIAFSLARTVRPNDAGSLNRALAALTAVLKPDVPQPIREGAIWSLGEIGGATAQRAVIDALKSDEEPKIREVATEALAKAGGTEALGLLSGAVLKDPSPAVRAGAARALGELDDPAAAKPLLMALRDADPYVRRAADEALAKVPPGDLGPFREALADPSPRVRTEAIERLGRSTEPDSLDMLLRALNDEDYTVRETAVSVLARRTDPQWTNGLVAALANDTLRVRMGAAAAIGRSLNPAAAGPLLDRLSAEQNASVKAEVIRALGSVGHGGNAAAAPLANEASDPDPTIRAAVATALGSFPDPASIQVLRALAEDEVEEVRLAAIASLRSLQMK